MKPTTAPHPMTSPDEPPGGGFGRRRLLALGLAAIAGKALSACSSSSSSSSPSPDAAAAADASLADSTSPTDAASTETATAEAATDAAAAETDAAIPWATGGTASMTGKASYPNPFASGAPATCALTCELTEGPCYSSQSVVIQDISYGYTGLPMRMYFQLLDDACKPVVGASIDVWHVSAVGKYSGDDSVNEDIAFCTANDADFTSHLYFRGKQTTDANGLAFFDSCFPGWYSSRTIHVHLTIRIGTSEYLTTQLFFADSLDDEIVDTQPIYKDRGPRDTTNQDDTVISAAGAPDYSFATQKMNDGAMLAWKTLVIRSSLSTAQCDGPAGASTTGGGPGGGDGGMPGAPP